METGEINSHRLPAFVNRSATDRIVFGAMLAALRGFLIVESQHRWPCVLRSNTVRITTEAQREHQISHHTGSPHERADSSQQLQDCGEPVWCEITVLAASSLCPLCLCGEVVSRRPSSRAVFHAFEEERKRFQVDAQVDTRELH